MKEGAKRGKERGRGSRRRKKYGKIREKGGGEGDEDIESGSRKRKWEK